MHKREIHSRIRRAAPALVLASFLLLGCATTPEDRRTGDSDEAAERGLDIERGPVGLVFRELSEASSLNVVLMNGLELGQAGPYHFEKRSAAAAILEIARDMGYEIHDGPQYIFVFAPGYETLRDVSLSGAIDEQVAGLRADVAFGADTPLYSALALLGHTLGHTVIADNAIAGALCGEIRLKDVPLGTALEALLQSARISRDSFHVESTPDYTFVLSTGNIGRRTLLHGKDALTDEQAAMLGREVRVTLPFPQDDPQHLRGRIGASTLGGVLEGLSQQLGITVTADERMHRLPVNPVVMTNVRVATAIELLIRQWLVPEFVYSVDDTGIRLRHMPPR